MSQSPWQNAEFARMSLRNIDLKFLSGVGQEIDFVEKELNLSPGEKVLDLGCGAGRHAIELARRGYAVVGIDISATLLEEARIRAKQSGVNVDFCELDMFSLEKIFSEATELFDGAICLGESGFGTQGWRKDIDLLQHVRMSLKANCKFILTTFNAIRKYRRYVVTNTGFDAVEGVQSWETPADWGGGEVLQEKQRVYIPSELAMMFEISGFQHVKIYGCSPGNWLGQKLQPDDIELMIVGAGY